MREKLKGVSIYWLDGDLETRVVGLIAEKTGLPPSEIMPETLLWHDLGIAGDDASELLVEYRDLFQVDMKEFNFARYFPSEIGFWCREREPVTVRDLVESAKRKRWTTPAVPQDPTRDR